MKTLAIRVFGQVQGVGYRYYAKLFANQLGVKGIIRNEPDGSVYIEAETSEANMAKFLDWVGQGPGAAKVERVITSEISEKHYSAFSIH